MNKRLIALGMMSMITACAESLQTDQQMPQQGNMGQQNTATQEMQCMGTSADEQTFAARLNPQNKTVFCQQFTSGQRSNAMMLACNDPSRCPTNQSNATNAPTPAKKTPMSPDQAVQKVMQDNGISMSEK